MSQHCFYIDETRCTGCRSCQIACKDKNRIMEAGPLFRRVNTYETGKFPAPVLYHLSTSCNHCENPACVEVCPSGAMVKSEADGVVLHDEAVCIGCQSCVSSCPYGIPQYFEEDGVVRKCDACRVLRELGKNPACVDACPQRAVRFGPADDIVAEFGGSLVRGVPAWPEASTGPNTYFRVRSGVEDEDFKKTVL